ncbi:hypothetical protein AVEN_219709-1 [Araneus ventricosus]|uniref:Gustatory receptor n=1 Tax=Araneus ventricosus TaxID=182803 RepID=A0A4Y2QRZ6_ARAVE|nr:hypothetical protein AVEN_219709-1 [Araneus ventricosus]
MYVIVMKINGCEIKWALERIISVTSSIVLMHAVIRKRYEVTVAMKRIEFMDKIVSEKKANILAGFILVSPFLYSSTVLMASEVGGDERGFLYFFYGISMSNKILKSFILFCKSFICYLLFPTYSNFFILTFCVIFYDSSLSVRNLSQEVERCPPQEFTTGIQLKYLTCRRKILKMLDELQANFSLMCFIACAGHFSYCFALITQIMLYSFRENALTYLADSAINLINVVIPLILMFWIPEQIPLEMENLNKIIRCKYEMRAGYGIVAENSTIEKLLLEEKIFVVSGCNLIFFRRRNILSVLGSALTYGLLLIGLEVRK